MFELKIMSAKSAIQECSWATKIISLVDPDGRFSKLDFGVKHHREKFHDEEFTTDINIILPSQEHIDRVLSFSRKFTIEDKVIVHCHAGICRSPAMAIGILVQAGMSPEKSVEYVFTIRPKSVPNKLILKH
jgi:predicted protein tyrosine phosphatase